MAEDTNMEGDVQSAWEERARLTIEDGRKEGEDARLKTRDLVKSGKVIRKRRKQLRKAEQPSKNIAKESVRLENVKKPVEKRVRMDEARKVDSEEGEDAMLKTRYIVKSGKVIGKRRKQMQEAEQPSKNIAKVRVRLEDVKKPVEKRVRMDGVRKVDREEGGDAILKTRNIVQSGKVKRKGRKQMWEAAQRLKNVAKERVRLEDMKQTVEKRVMMDEARKVDTIMRKIFEDVRDEIFTFLSMKEKEITNELDSIFRTHSTLSST